jgi:hypothetical protein
VSDSDFAAQVASFATAPTLDRLPDVVDVRATPPPNPPEEIQVKFVGTSYAGAYAEAESFVRVSDDFARKHGPGPFSSLRRIVDFGSGWGRITRTLLLKTEPSKLFAVDVDQQMTALLNTTLPGVNAMTVTPEPPTVLGDGAIDAVLAFSVFSHLSGPAHEAWATEFGRLVAPGGVVAITVLDEAFFTQVANAQAAVAAGAEDGFSAGLATTFPDLERARAAFGRGQIQFAGTGGGEVRTEDYYGWAAAPRKYIERVWGRAGFRLVEWVPSGVLFQQALAFLVAGDGPRAAGSRRRPVGAAGTVARVARRLSRRGA